MKFGKMNQADQSLHRERVEAASKALNVPIEEIEIGDNEYYHFDTDGTRVVGVITDDATGRVRDTSFVYRYKRV